MRSFIRNFLTISRVDLQIGTPATALIGILISYKVPPLIPSILYISLCILMITFASNVNCLYDFYVDRRYKKHLANAVKEIGERKIKIILLFELILIIIIALSFKYVIISILSMIGLFLSYFYSAPPLRIKEKGIFSQLPTFTGLYFLPLLGGWLLSRNDFPPYFIIFLISYTLMNSGYLLINVSEDYEEDLEEGIKTWAHVFGMRKTIWIAFIFSLFGFLCILSIFSVSISSVFLIIAFAGMVKASHDIYRILQARDIVKATKKCAKKLPVWFFLTRYPMLLSIIIKYF